MTPTIDRVKDRGELSRRAAAAFAAAARDAIELRGRFRVALAGGTTPKALYERLAGDESVRTQIAWDRVQFFWGDERHVPPDHADSNFRMAREAMLDPLGIEPSQWCRIEGENPDAAAAATAYEASIRSAWGLGHDGVPRFDLVLLGMGADGHTASLFPDTEALGERGRLAVANWVPTFGAARITLTPPVLNAAAAVLFLVQGADKAEALAAVLEGPYHPSQYPAQLVRPQAGRVGWLVDQAAAARLSDPSSPSGL